MLHGLASSPEAWVELASEILGDEALRQHYQIWQVYYPTNMPIALNHAMMIAGRSGIRWRISILPARRRHRPTTCTGGA